MKKSIRCFGILVVAGMCALPVFTGCAGNKLPTEFVTGTLTLDGQPLDGTRIFFSPVEGGVSAYGHTNGKGVYMITALEGGREGRGTVAGEYIVTISKPEVVPNPDGASYDTKQLLPLVYMDPAHTPFRASVVKGRNTFHFDLKSKPDIDFKPSPGFRN